VVSQIAQLLQLGIAAFVIVALMVELARRPLAMVVALLGVHAWSLLFGLPYARVAGIGISPDDVVNFIALGAAVIRMRRGPRGWQWALLVAVALIVYATLRGLVQLGDDALLGFRLELYFVVPALFVATLPASAGTRVVRSVVLFGAVIAFIAVVRWVLLAIGAGQGGFMGGGDYAVSRVINSSAALWVAFACVAGAVSLLERGTSRGRWKLQALTAITFVVVVLAQHRSVWVAAAVMLAVALVVTRRRWLEKAAIVVIAGVAVAVIEVAGLGTAGPVAESLAFAASNTHTWEWRLERWVDVWSTHAERGVEAVVLGSGYGYGWVSGVVGTWEASPHNGFLQIAVRIGLLGALLVFAPYVLALRRLPTFGGGVARVLWLWVIGALVYYVPYSGNMLTGVLLGAAVAASVARPRSAVEVPWAGAGVRVPSAPTTGTRPRSWAARRLPSRT